jgi:hypothetical protein
MRRLKTLLIVPAALALFGLATAGDEPLYDEKADAHRQVEAAIAVAAKSGRRVVLVFGANW